MAAKTSSADPLPTAVLALADGTVLYGEGAGATGTAVGEVCFNTAMTGYQEILTDPSYAAQIVTFTFPHIGNVGANPNDAENATPSGGVAARGAVLRERITKPSNWRAHEHFSDWLCQRGVIALCGVDTRALTRRIRETGMPNGVICHQPDGVFDVAALVAEARAWGGLENLDLAIETTSRETSVHDTKQWVWPAGYTKLESPRYEVVVIDYGAKGNILRCLADIGARTTLVAADTPSADILARKPDGVVLSNGPGDPAATGAYAVGVIRDIVESGTPVLGICLGHQMLALALGAKTRKMAQGHHGANHPVQDKQTGKVEIVSMNHGFTVDTQSLPANVRETHVSLFDGTNCGIALTGRPVFSVQHHPEASPGPRDSFYLFERFAALMDDRRRA